MLLKKKNIFLILIVVLSFYIASCTVKTEVARTDPNTPTDLSGRWNDTDSRLVAEEVIKDVLGSPWLDDHIKRNGKIPTVIVGYVYNKSPFNVNVDTFMNDLEKELTNSGKVRFVAKRGEREEIRDEREDQAQYSSGETAKRRRNEAGADYILKGKINTIVDKTKAVKIIFYQVDLSLIDIEKNTKVWMGQKKIKKIVYKRIF